MLLLRAIQQPNTWTNFFFGWSDLLPKQKFPGLQEATCGLVGHYWPDPLPNEHSVVVNFNVRGMWCPSIMYVELRATNFLPTNLLVDRSYRAESWWLSCCQYHWALCSPTAVEGSLTLHQSCRISRPQLQSYSVNSSPFTPHPSPPPHLPTSPPRLIQLILFGVLAHKGRSFLGKKEPGYEANYLSVWN